MKTKISNHNSEKKIDNNCKFFPFYNKNNNGKYYENLTFLTFRLIFTNQLNKRANCGQI